MKMKLHSLFLSLFVAILLGSCSSQPKGSRLVIQLDSPSGGDTLALVTYIGPDVQITDTLTNFDTRLELYLDTARFHSVLVSHDEGRRVRLFDLIGKEWREQIAPAPTKVHPLTSAPLFSGKDASGKQRELSDLYHRRSVMLVFASPEGLSSLTKQEQTSLRAGAKPDSLSFVFMMPTLSDSTARSQLRRDSLEGIAFSDSLGLVSRVRQLYGVQGQAGVVRFRIDSLGKIR